MATYAEINAILTDTVSGAQLLREKVGVASLIAAQMIIAGDDDGAPFDQTAGAHDQRILWASRLLSNNAGVTREMFDIVVVANRAFTQSQILNATDVAIQTNVNASIDSLAKNLTVPPGVL